MKLKELIPPERILLDINAASVEEVIAMLVDHLAKTEHWLKTAAVKQAVLERERHTLQPEAERG